MSKADILKWDGKYRTIDKPGGAEPDEELATYLDLLPRNGQAMDLACGLGKNSLFLAQQGLNVVALDGSIEGLNRLQKSAKNQGLTDRIQVLQADLDHYTLPESCYDLILVVRYLNRELLESIASALRPGGILIYKTFNRNILRQRPGFSLAYTIEAGELIHAFPSLAVLADNHADTKSEYAFFIGRKA